MRNPDKTSLQTNSAIPPALPIEDRRVSDGKPLNPCRNDETLAVMFKRVATAIADTESNDAEAVEVRSLAESFERMLSAMDFLPNSPTLMNAGTATGVLSGCFVLPITGEADQVDDTMSLMAKLQRAGAGTGYSFSLITGQPGGPNAVEQLIQLMQRIDEATSRNVAFSPRRGANMGILRVDHPAIDAFIASKRDGRSFANFNLSVGITDRFMECVKQDRRFTLRDPQTHRPIVRVWAKDLLKSIAEAAWASGDPGVVFLDAIERANPVPKLGPINATNPCGEAPLLPFESCTLGSINLSNMLRSDSSGALEIDWHHLEMTTRLAVRFLDNVIDASRWPDERVAAATQQTRKIGLGVMGLADLFVRMRIAYDSPQAEHLAAQVMAYISHAAHSASEELAEQRGVFPAWDQSVYADHRVLMRNAVCTSIAPTGTISRIAGVSAGIEPFFDLTQSAFGAGSSGRRACGALQRFAHDNEHDLDALLEHYHQTGTLIGAPGVRDYEAHLFKTGPQIHAHHHLAVQAAFQQHTDQAVAKTVNLPEQATVEEVQELFTHGWEMELKGATVFRWGCRPQQPLG